MSRHIILEKPAIGLDFSITASGEALNELERTPGAVAVKRTYGGGLAEGLISPPVSSPTNSLPTTAKIKRRLDPASRCSTGAIITNCHPNGHMVGKLLLCGVDWCPECGKVGSRAHNRRISAWLPKFQQMDSIGYFVIEFPDKWRHDIEKLYSKTGKWRRDNPNLYPKTGIWRINAIVKGVMAGKRGTGNKRSGGYFPDGGVARWHWAGDRCKHAIYDGSPVVKCKLSGQTCPKNKNKCDNFENDGKLNQHINLVVRGGFVDADKLAQIKADLAAALDCPKLVVHYSYASYNYETQDAGAIYQKLAYITRPTFKDRAWDEKFATDVLYNFHSSFWWGKWNGSKIWAVNPDMEAEGLEAAAAIGQCKCHICGGALEKWSKPVPSVYLEILGATEIGHTGYYSIPDAAPGADFVNVKISAHLSEIERLSRGLSDCSRDALSRYVYKVAVIRGRLDSGAIYHQECARLIYAAWQEYRQIIALNREILSNEYGSSAGDNQPSNKTAQSGQFEAG